MQNQAELGLRFAAICVLLNIIVVITCHFFRPTTGNTRSTFFRKHRIRRHPAVFDQVSHRLADHLHIQGAHLCARVNGTDMLLVTASEKGTAWDVPTGAVKLYRLRYGTRGAHIYLLNLNVVCQHFTGGKQRARYGTHLYVW